MMNTLRVASNVITSWRIGSDCSFKITQHAIFKRHIRSVKKRGFTAAEEAKLAGVMKEMNLLRTQAEASRRAYEKDQCQGAIATSPIIKNQRNGYSKKEETTEFDLPSKVEVTMDNKYELLASKVTPLCNVPYEIQLKIKFARNLRILRNFGKELKETKTKTFIDPDNSPCALDTPVPSPQLIAYRNKDEFSIRPGVDGEPKTVGFFLDSIAENPNTLCIGPENIIIIKDSHKHVAKEFEKYIRMSDLPACINFDDGGYWRNIIVRSNSKDEVMAVVTMHPRNLTNDELKAEMEKLKHYFSQESFSAVNLKSLYFQACSKTRCTHAESPFQLLLGQPYLEEEMNGCRYRISPESFFQVNTRAAENLYKIIFNACKPKKYTTILDICCGTGPVSLTFCKHVQRCIGIDTSEQAIVDARENAKLNNADNVSFHVGRCESLLPDLLQDVYAEELVAVVNPSRSPLGKLALSTLRSIKYLKKVIFVTCKPEAMTSNFVQLCCPTDKRNRLGKPFVPLRAVPVDIFPHTEHCELVILFQRL